MASRVPQKSLHGVGKITKRIKGFSKWIKFGAKHLSLLLQGVELAHSPHVLCLLSGGKEIFPCVPKRKESIKDVGGASQKLRALDVELPLGFFEVLKANNSLAPGCIAKSIKEGTPFSNAVKDGWRGVGKVVWFQFGVGEVVVKTDGRKVPRSLQVMVRKLYFAIQLWWEIPPWMLVVKPLKLREGLGLMEMIGPLALREPYAISHQAKTMSSSNREGFKGSLLSNMIVSVKDDLKPTVEKRFLVKVVLLTPMDVIVVKEASYFPRSMVHWDDPLNRSFPKAENLMVGTFCFILKNGMMVEMLASTMRGGCSDQEEGFIEEPSSLCDSPPCRASQIFNCSMDTFKN
ncbi:hypothetical protein CK203_108091 [Vitis vinifera]|uniref:Uncharacterized protein n=1 Tax=Vitis vinifera TaxID=29760 RepID=A0A438BN56_VITVI|nr:hypothetical protein CK203_108091 [Vitis vinifera]